MGSDSISRADIVSDGIQTRRGRYRITTEKSTPIADDTNSEIKTAAKVPVYRVRGRQRSKQNTETEKIVDDTTTVKSIGESNRTIRRKTYAANKQRTVNSRNENQSTETMANKDSVSLALHSTQTISSRKNATLNHFESVKKSNSPETLANHQSENHRKAYNNDIASTRKTPTGRRYRIRVVEANAINANAQINDNEKKISSSTSATNDLKSTLKGKKSERDGNIDDEQNYPEHFKALLKSKKSTIPPLLSSSTNRTNYLPLKKSTTSTTSVSSIDSPSTLRTAYKHKKIERPNLKLLFPSLQKSSTSTTTTESTTFNDNESMATDELNTETATPIDMTSTTEKLKTTVSKQIGGVKFSSKIRSDSDRELASISAFRSRSTPLVFDTQKSSTHRTSDGLPTNHRFSSVSVKQTNKKS